MVGRLLALLALSVAVSIEPGVAAAAPKTKGKPATTAKPKPKKASQSETDTARSEAGEPETKASEDATGSAAEARPNKDAKGDSVKATGTTATEGAAPAKVEVKEEKSGVKTYKFETVEVEGRLKSPHVIYFLRRVRAEFDAGALGHRSFMGELSDSRRSAAFR
jgi:hypothetical protein